MSGHATEQILDYLAGKDLLLIVDNCEHLIDECAELAEQFLAKAGAARLLATSRECLDVGDERVLQISPLSIDDAGSSTVIELFAARARAVNSSFSVSKDNRGVVAQLCRRLLHGGRRRQRQRTLEATLDELA